MSTLLCVLFFSVVTFPGFSSAIDCLSLLSLLSSIDILLPSFLIDLHASISFKVGLFCASSASTSFTLHITLGRRAMGSQAAEPAGCRFPSDSSGSCAKAAPPMPASLDCTSPRTCSIVQTHRRPVYIKQYSSAFFLQQGKSFRCGNWGRNLLKSSCYRESITNHTSKLRALSAHDAT